MAVTSTYKGYLITEFSEKSEFFCKQHFKWEACNLNDNDESTIIEKTFEDVLNEIDERTSNQKQQNNGTI